MFFFIVTLSIQNSFRDQIKDGRVNHKSRRRLQIVFYASDLKLTDDDTIEKLISRTTNLHEILSQSWKFDTIIVLSWGLTIL